MSYQRSAGASCRCESRGLSYRDELYWLVMALALILAQVDEQINEALGRQVRWTNLIRAGVPREHLLTQDLDQLLADREAVLRVAYWERQQQTQADAVVDLTC